MAVTLEEVKSKLDEIGFNYQDSNKHDSAVHLMFGDDNFDGYVKIELEEDGELIQFYCNQMIEAKPLAVKDHENKLLVLQFLLDRNYKEKFGTWELDPSDGEIRFAVEIPLEDNTLTDKQFARIMKRVAGTQEEFEAIDKILETGEYPESNSEAAMLLELLEMMRTMKKAEDDGI